MSEQQTYSVDLMIAPCDLLTKSERAYATELHRRWAEVALRVVTSDDLTVPMTTDNKQSMRVVSSVSGGVVVEASPSEQVMWRSASLPAAERPVSEVDIRVLASKMARCLNGTMNPTKLAALTKAETDTFTADADRRLSQFVVTKTLRDAWEYLRTRPIFSAVLQKGAPLPDLTTAQAEMKFDSMQSAAEYIHTKVYPMVFDKSYNKDVTQEDIKRHGLRQYRLIDPIRRIISGSKSDDAALDVWRVYKALKKEERNMSFTSGNRAIAFLNLHYPSVFQVKRANKTAAM
jgi:hypothetical protein